MFLQCQVPADATVQERMNVSGVERPTVHYVMLDSIAVRLIRIVAHVYQIPGLLLHKVHLVL